MLDGLVVVIHRKCLVSESDTDIIIERSQNQCKNENRTVAVPYLAETLLSKETLMSALSLPGRSEASLMAAASLLPE